MPDNSDLFGVGGGAAARKPIPKPNMAAPGDTAAQRSGAVAPPARKGAPGEPAKATPGEAGYDASTIEVLEGLEPVRRRPGMYIGGTDEKGLHHLFAEGIGHARDEAVAGHAPCIEVEFQEARCLSVHGNGGGIPIDPHPK